MFRRTKMKTIVLLLIFFQLSGCYSLNIPENPVENHPKPIVLKSRSLVPNCDGVISILCMKMRAISYLEALSESRERSLFSGLVLVKDNEEDQQKKVETLKEIARNFPDDAEQRVNSYLTYKVLSFLENHSLKFNMIDKESSRTVSELVDYDDDADVFDDDDDDDDDYEGREGPVPKKGKKVLKKYGPVIFIVLTELFKAVTAFGFTTAILFMVKKAILVSIVAIVGAFATLLIGEPRSEVTEVKPNGNVFFHEHPEFLARVGKELNDYVPRYTIDLPDHLKNIE